MWRERSAGGFERKQLGDSSDAEAPHTYNLDTRNLIKFGFKMNNEHAIAHDGSQDIHSARTHKKVGHDAQYVRVMDHAHVADAADLDVTVPYRFRSQASLPRHHAVGLRVNRRGGDRRICSQALQQRITHRADASIHQGEKPSCMRRVRLVREWRRQRDNLPHQIWIFLCEFTGVNATKAPTNQGHRTAMPCLYRLEMRTQLQKPLVKPGVRPVIDPLLPVINLVAQLLQTAAHVSGCGAVGSKAGKHDYRMAIATWQGRDGIDDTGKVIGYRTKRLKREKHCRRRLKFDGVDKFLREVMARMSLIKSMRLFLMRRTKGTDAHDGIPEGLQAATFRPCTWHPHGNHFTAS